MTDQQIVIIFMIIVGTAIVISITRSLMMWWLGTGAILVELKRINELLVAMQKEPESPTPDPLLTQNQPKINPLTKR